MVFKLKRNFSTTNLQFGAYASGTINMRYIPFQVRATPVSPNLNVCSTAELY